MKRMIKSETTELVNQIAQNTGQNPLVKRPRDDYHQYMTDHGDVITKVNTDKVKATGRQYSRKDGSPGKRTITIMEPDPVKPVIFDDDIVDRTSYDIYDPEINL